MSTMQQYRSIIWGAVGVAGCALAIAGCAGEDEGVADVPLSGSEEEAQGGQLRVLQRGDTGPEVRDLYLYLRAFGYFPNPALHEYQGWKPVLDREPADPDSFDELLEAALLAYQRAHGLRADGVLNEETLALMNQPRCGFPDYYGGAPSAKGTGTSHYSPSGYKWANGNLTFSYLNYTGDLPSGTIQWFVRGSLDRWAGVTGLSFTQTSANGDIQIGFYQGDHGDGYPFDGPYNVLAHAFYPSVGDAHFDDAENWSENGSGIDFASVAVHEFGHSIGLNHSADANAVMYAAYSTIRRDLTNDDISGAQAMYGLKPIAWSPAGPLAGRYCTQIHEGSDPHTWHDNYLCSTVNYGIQWSSAGPIGGLRCTQITEGSEPAAHRWEDNYLCVPTNSPLYFSWSSAGPIAGKTCTQWYESADPHTWMDNFLCY